MAEAVVTVALEAIRLLFNEGNFLSGVRDQVKKLLDTLKLLRSFLKDADARKHDNETIQTWVCQATRLAYRAEDTVEEYAVKVASNRGGGFRRAASIVGEGISTHKVGNEIAKIHTEIANLIKELADYGINRIIEAQPSSAAIEREWLQRATNANEVDKYFVGMEDDVSKIVTWVTEDDKTHRVISICGMGGLGKTTIARKVYNHCQEQRSFESFAWVTVTKQCPVKMLLQDILIQVLGNKEGDNIRNMEVVTLFRELPNVLKNKKCFVVLDDIWNLDDWQSLHRALESCKILLTTRTRAVANVAERHSQHKPKVLDDKDGWDLLTKIAETQGNELPENVERIGKNMLRKCGGLPLAISVLGGILRNKDPLTAWETVNQKFGAYMSESGGLSVLALSYDDLSSCLKSCFLYMGCFKEDENIDVAHLYQLWMAEGLIPPTKQGPGESLMDVASEFLDELISRNIVQSQVWDILTDTKSCRLHDLIRELCLSKGKEEQFLEVKSKQIVENMKASVVRHDGLDLCRQSILVEYLGRESIWVQHEYRPTNLSIELSSHVTYIRALVINSPIKYHLKGLGSNFKSLRSLILDNCKFKGNKLPKQIRDMIHLRCLSLQNSLNDGKLPSFIGELQYLQTLNLAHNICIHLPNIFHKMKRLRCLYLPSIYSKRQSVVARLEFHGLKDLEVLEGFDSRYHKVSEFINIRRFRAFIWGYEDLSTTLVQLRSLSKLQYISIIFQIEKSESELEKSFPDLNKLLDCPHLHNLYLFSPIGKFPRYEPHFWPDFVSLTLKSTCLKEDPMPFLQELPNLRELAIKEDAFVGKEMYCSSKAFPKLTSLLMYGLDNIEIWRVDAGAFPNLTSLEIGCLPKIETFRVDAGAFPNLSTLQIWGCKSFEIVPDGLTNITSLTRIDIEYMPEEFSIKYGRLQTGINDYSNGL